MTNPKRRLVALLLVLLIAIALSLPAGATEGWHLGMSAGELTAMLKKGASVLDVSVLTCRSWEFFAPPSDKYPNLGEKEIPIWAPGISPAQELEVKVEKVLYGKKLYGRFTCMIPSAHEIEAGSRLLLRLDKANETNRNRNKEYVETFGVDLTATEFDFGPYDVGYAAPIDDDTLYTPPYYDFEGSEVENTKVLTALLAGTLKAPHPSEHPVSEFDLYPSIYYYEAGGYADPVGYERSYTYMESLVVTSDLAIVYALPEDSSPEMHRARRGDILLGCSYAGADEGQENPFPGWQRILLSVGQGDSLCSREGYVKANQVTEGVRLPYGSEVIPMKASVYLLDRDGNTDKSHVLRKGTMQAVCATQAYGGEELLLLSFGADRPENRRYLRPRFSSKGESAAFHLPPEEEIVSIKEAVDSGWVLDPLLMPPDWGTY